MERPFFWRAARTITEADRPPSIRANLGTTTANPNPIGTTAVSMRPMGRLISKRADNPNIRAKLILRFGATINAAHPTALQTGRVIDKKPREAKAFGDFARQRFDTERLGLVVTAIEDV